MTLSSLFSYMKASVGTDHLWPGQIQGEMGVLGQQLNLTTNYFTLPTQDSETEALNIRNWMSTPFFFYLPMFYMMHIMCTIHEDDEKTEIQEC